MEIGGYDLLFDTLDPKGLAKRIQEFVNWPDAVTQSAFDFPGEEDDFFWYENAAAKEVWDQDGAIEEVDDKMIYFLIREGHLTAVVGSGEMAKAVKEFVNGIT
jgi:hypothetical protein